LADFFLAGFFAFFALAIEFRDWLLNTLEENVRRRAGRRRGKACGGRDTLHAGFDVRAVCEIILSVSNFSSARAQSRVKATRGRIEFQLGLVRDDRVGIIPLRRISRTPRDAFKFAQRSSPLRDRIV
jgi:hypothetical protein